MQMNTDNRHIQRDTRQTKIHTTDTGTFYYITGTEKLKIPINLTFLFLMKPRQLQRSYLLFYGLHLHNTILPT